jgi:hypothetical protein
LIMHDPDVALQRKIRRTTFCTGWCSTFPGRRANLPRESLPMRSCLTERSRVRTRVEWSVIEGRERRIRTWSFSNSSA